jgi:hypothetical protein
MCFPISGSAVGLGLREKEEPDAEEEADDERLPEALRVGERPRGDS